MEHNTDDVQTVLLAHGVNIPNQDCLNKIYDSLDHSDIEAGVLYFCTLKAQTNSMLSDIEDQLMREGIIESSDKKFIVDELDDHEQRQTD